MYILYGIIYYYYFNLRLLHKSHTVMIYHDISLCLRHTSTVVEFLDEMVRFQLFSILLLHKRCNSTDFSEIVSYIIYDVLFMLHTVARR